MGFSVFGRKSRSGEPGDAALTSPGSGFGRHRPDGSGINDVVRQRGAPGTPNEIHGAGSAVRDEGFTAPCGRFRSGARGTGHCRRSGVEPGSPRGPGRSGPVAPGSSCRRKGSVSASRKRPQCRRSGHRPTPPRGAVGLFRMMSGPPFWSVDVMLSSARQGRAPMTRRQARRSAGAPTARLPL